LREEAESLRQQRDKLQQLLATPVEREEVESSTPVPSKVPGNLREEWLTTGEAYQNAASQGFVKSKGTFRRLLNDALATGRMPSELKRLGLVANFDVRQKANAKDNSVRWLRFEV